MSIKKNSFFSKFSGLLSSTKNNEPKVEQLLKHPSNENSSDCNQTDKAQKEAENITKTEKSNWLHRLKSGLSQTRNQLVSNLQKIWSNQSIIDDNLLEQLHEALYKSDIGNEACDHLIESIRSKYNNKSVIISWEEIQEELKRQILYILNESEQKKNGLFEHIPTIVLIVGVNGAGKTTTIGKIAANMLAENKSVMLCAADTFRAAAIDQLQIWANRLQIEMIKHKPGSDPSAVVFDAVKSMIARKIDYLIVDTAGRLHNKVELMNELHKINRVITKNTTGINYEVWMIIDATTGQNALMQLKTFKEYVPVSGLVVTKLDGTAKGGVIISLSQKYKTPIKYIGIGETTSDLRPFSAQDYVNSIFDVKS